MSQRVCLLCAPRLDVMLNRCLALAKLACGGLFDSGLNEDLGDLCAITPDMLITKYNNNEDFIECVWLFAVPVSQTKAEARELLTAYGNNIFQADLSDDIA